MEERITISKHSILKSLVVAGLKSKGYNLIQATKSRYPVKVYHNTEAGSVAIFNSGPHQNDELLFVSLNKPGKVKILIKEYRSRESLMDHGKQFVGIAELIEKILKDHQKRKISDDKSQPLAVVK